VGFRFFWNNINQQMMDYHFTTYPINFFAHFFNFIGSPQQVMLPVQQVSVEQQVAPHSFTTLSSKPHVAGAASICRAAGSSTFVYYFKFEAASLTNKNLFFLQFATVHLMPPQFA